MTVCSDLTAEGIQLNQHDKLKWTRRYESSCTCDQFGGLLATGCCGYKIHAVL